MSFKPTKFVMPAVRRVFASNIASEIVSVQPMTMPSGLLNFMYGVKCMHCNKNMTIEDHANAPWLYTCKCGNFKIS